MCCAPQAREQAEAEQKKKQAEQEAKEKEEKEKKEKQEKAEREVSCGAHCATLGRDYLSCLFAAAIDYLFTCLLCVFQHASPNALDVHLVSNCVYYACEIFCCIRSHICICVYSP